MLYASFSSRGFIHGFDKAQNTLQSPLFQKTSTEYNNQDFGTKAAFLF